MQQLQPMVANAKLDRPLDSHPPLSRELMLTRLEADDWGDSTAGAQYEQEEHVYAEHYDDSYDHGDQEHREHLEYDTEQDLVNLAIQYIEAADLVVEEVYMTEIQLRRIVDRTAKEQQPQQSDGD